MNEYIYSIHGIRIKINTNSATIISAAKALIGGFESINLTEKFVLEATFIQVKNRNSIPILNCPSEQIIFENKEVKEQPYSSSWKYKICRQTERNIADFEDIGVLVIDTKQRQIEGYIVEYNVVNSNAIFNFFRFALIELLKLEKLYIIHAAALEKEGRGLLIPGYSGHGKTTSCISLIRSGYRCLSDDHPILREDETGLNLLPFLTKIDVTEKTIEFFPELRDAKELLYQGVQKKYFNLQDIYPHAQAEPCVPSLIIFPQIVDSSKSRIELLPKTKALEKLLPHTLLVWDRNVTKQQFQSLSRLVEKTICYQMYLGEDILDIPKLIEPLIKDEKICAKV